MSVRAYKILKMEYAKTPAFNVWHNRKFMDWLETQEADINLNENGGEISIQVATLKKAIKNQKKLELDDFQVRQMKEDIKGMENDDWVDYTCF